MKKLEASSKFTCSKVKQIVSYHNGLYDFVEFTHESEGVLKWYDIHLSITSYVEIRSSGEGIIEIFHEMKKHLCTIEFGTFEEFFDVWLGFEGIEQAYEMLEIVEQKEKENDSLTERLV